MDDECNHSEDAMKNGKTQKDESEEENGDDVVDLEDDSADAKDVEFAEEIINLDDKETEQEEKDSSKDVAKKKPSEEGKKKKLPSAEEDIGITGYAGDHSGFFGIIKQRSGYSDFQINEVDGNGEIIRLTTQVVPEDPEDIPDMPEEMPAELSDVKLRELDRLMGILKPQPEEAEVKEEDDPVVVEVVVKEEEVKVKKEDSVKAKEEDVKAKEKDVKAKEKDVKAKEKDVKAKEKDVKAKEKDVKANEKDVKANEKDVKAKEKDVKAKEKDVKAKEEDVKDKGKDVKAKEKDVELIKEEVEDGEKVKEEDAEKIKEEDDDATKSVEEGDEEKEKDDTQKEEAKEKKGPTKEVLPALSEIWINVDCTDEEGVALVHQAIKAKFRGVDSVYGETMDGGKYVVVRKRKVGGLRKEKTPWPKEQMYTTFILFKENVETIEAINQIAWKARVKPSCFAFAGTKEKRAKTSQLVSVKEVSPHRLMLATKNLRSVHIGNFHFRDKPQRANLQFGNHYRIVLREVDGTDEEVLEAVESLKTKGFINFYGTQPFGSNSVFLRGIGCELLKGNWQQAVNLILAPRDSDVPDLHRCHTTWKDTGDAEAALKILCKGWEATVESQLLTGLVQLTGNDLVEALNRIPRSTRTLYLHAYQSWIWNTIASRRVNKYGLKVLPGDIVRRKGSLAEVEEIDVENQDNDREGEESKSGDETDTKTEMEVTESNGQNMCGFHFLSEEEAEVADIADVVLPLPGYNVEYPKNDIKDWYAELLEADGLTFSSLKHEIKAYAARGVYRRMVIVPTNVSGTLCHYRDATKALLQSDVDKLWSVKVDDNLLKEGPNKAAVVELTLPSSSYISVALRELLKRDTSWQLTLQFQAAQNLPSNVIDRKQNTGRGGNRGRGWRVNERGSWKPTPWAASWNDRPGWQQGRGRASFSPWADQGNFRGNRDFGWSGNRGGGYGAHVINAGAWGRGDKRPWRGGDSWANKRGRF